MSDPNREQIIKGLECCNISDGTICDQCPYYNIETADDEVCSERMAEDALALINSQDQRIKELTEEYDSMAKSVNESSDLIRKLRSEKKELTEENERLKAELAERPPKLIITKLPKKDQITKEMLEGG